MTLSDGYFIERVRGYETRITINETSLNNTIDKLQINDYDFSPLNNYINKSKKY